MIQPIRNNVLVKCFEGDNVSKGGIIVPDAYKKESNKVEVVAVGNGSTKKPMRLKEGDIGYRVKDWGTEIIEDGQKYYLMDESAIIALQ
jgi:chaperonin GroES